MARIHLKIHSSDIPALRKATDKIKLEAAKELRKSVAEATATLFNEVVRTTPIGKNYANKSGGNLQAGNRMNIKGLRGHIWNPVVYAKWVHYGTSPYTIRPKAAKALAFRINGRLIFTKKVNHPGIKANPWYDKALDRMQREIDKINSEGADRVAALLTK